MKQIKQYAPAKLNFGLQVLNKREDGYHNINTVFIKINLFDELVFEQSDNFNIYCNPDLGIPAKHNIIYKTIELLSDYYKKDLSKYSISLTKRIPSGAGLGGGSTDAATTIKVLNSLHNLTNDYDELNQIASQIGSDVPFFLKNGDAIGTGKGEILDFINFKLDYHILLIYPNIHVSTPFAYRALNRNKKQIKKTDFKSFISNFEKNKIDIKKFVYNDFEDAVFKMHNEIRNIKEDLINSGAVFSLLTGSGSCVYGFFNSLETAESAKTNFSEYQTFLVQKL